MTALVATCQSCRFRVLTECRRLPPAPILMPCRGPNDEIFYQVTTSFPHVDESSWCGEHRNLTPEEE